MNKTYSNIIRINYNKLKTINKIKIEITDIKYRIYDNNYNVNINIL